MKNKIKSWMVLIGILGVLFGRILNRVLSSYFGSSASAIIVTVIIIFMLCINLILIIMRRYIAAIASFFMIIPLIVGGIGLYLNNLIVAGIGILLILVVYPLLAIVIPKLKRDR